MAEATSYTFTHQELVALLVKAANVHEGKWMISVTFGFAPGNFGPSATDLNPGAVVAVQKIGIQKADSAAPENNLAVDAAKVNPA